MRNVKFLMYLAEEQMEALLATMTTSIVSVSALSVPAQQEEGREESETLSHSCLHPSGSSFLLPPVIGLGG